jgi:hypothetical protein
MSALYDATVGYVPLLVVRDRYKCSGEAQNTTLGDRMLVGRNRTRFRRVFPGDGVCPVTT